MDDGGQNTTAIRRANIGASSVVGTSSYHDIVYLALLQLLLNYL